MPKEHEEDVEEQKPDTEEETGEEEKEEENQDTSEESTDESLSEQDNESEEEPTFELDGEKLTASQIKEYKEDAAYRERYNELQPQNTRISQELADTKKQLEEKENYDQMPEEQRNAQDFIKGVVEEQVNERIRPITAKQRELEAITEIDQLHSNYDWATKDQMARAAKHADDSRLPISAAFRDLFFDEVMEKSKTQGSNTARNNLERKKAAITETSKGGAGKTKSNIDVSKYSYQELLEMEAKAGK